MMFSCIQYLIKAVNPLIRVSAIILAPLILALMCTFPIFVSASSTLQRLWRVGFMLQHECILLYA